MTEKIVNKENGADKNPIELTTEEINERIRKVLINFNGIENLGKQEKISSQTQIALLNALNKEFMDEYQFKTCELKNEDTENTIQIRYQKLKIVKKGKEKEKLAIGSHKLYEIPLAEILKTKEEYQQDRNIQARIEANTKFQDTKRKKRLKDTQERITREKREHEEGQQMKEQIEQYISEIIQAIGLVHKGHIDNLKKTLKTLMQKRNKKYPSKPFPLENMKLTKNTSEFIVYNFGKFRILGAIGHTNYIHICSNEYYLQIKKYCKKNNINKLTRNNIQEILQELGEDQRNI